MEERVRRVGVMGWGGDVGVSCYREGCGCDGVVIC